MRTAADRQFDELYQEHFRSVLAYCRRRIPEAEAYDAANETFEIAWRRIEDVPVAAKRVGSGMAPGYLRSSPGMTANMPGSARPREGDCQWRI